MKRFLLLVLVLLVPGYVFADTGVSGFNFTPPQTDLAVSFLGDIFGVVTGVLHGTGGQIFGTMFGIFNAAVLSFGSIIVMYTLFVGTLYTAHEGKALGEKWGSLWVPIRTVIGIGAMIPQATGYSFIQIFIMWLVVQGVGAADSIWNGALTYIERGGIIVQSAQSLNSMGNATATSPNENINSITNVVTSNPKIIFTAGNILKSETCMYIIHNALMKQAAQNPNPSGAQVPDFTSSLQVTGAISKMSPPCYLNDSRPGCAGQVDTTGVVFFPGNVSSAGANYNGICGAVNWDISVIPQGQPNAGAPDTSVGGTGGGLDSRSTAVMQMVLDMQPQAFQLAQIQFPPQGGGPNEITNSDFPPSPAQTVDSATDYMSIMGPYFNLINNSSIQSATQTLEQAKSQGWLMAGSYYFLLSSLNNAYGQTQVENKFPIASYPSNFANVPGVPSLAVGSLMAMSSIGPVTPGTCSRSGPNNSPLLPIDSFICREYTTAVHAPNTPNSGIAAPGVPTAYMPLIPNLGSTSDFAVSGLDALIQPVISFINYIPDKFNGLMSEINNLLVASQMANVDPIVAISAMGIDILDAAEYIWISGAIGAAVVGIAVGAIPSTSMGTAITTFVVWIVGFLTVILMAMFETGMVMAYYIPLIPFIIFLFTSLGWFVGVIEAIIAGPLVALGLTVPEGHHQFGAVSHAIMLLMNIFLRPSLIIFGFIAGAIMSHVGLWIMNDGLSIALGAGQTPVNADMSNVLRALALLIVYTTLILQVVNRAFQLIYEIPNTVLQWLSPGANREFGEAKGIDQVSEQVRGKFGALGGTVGEVGKQAMSVGPAMQKLFSGKGDKGGGGGDAAAG